MDRLDDFRLGQAQQIVVSLKIAFPVLKALSAKTAFIQGMALDHGAHRAIEDQDSLAQPALKKINPHFRPDWVTGRWLFKGPYAQPIITTEYRNKKPDHRTPVEGLYLENMTQIYPEDRGTNYAVAIGRRAAGSLLQAKSLESVA